MAVTETLAGDLREYAERPGVVLLALACLYLFADLIGKLTGVSASIGGIQVFGGNIAFSQVVSYLYDGLVLGLIIGLAGVGLSMTYSILNFANFAHGDYLTAGAFSGWAGAYVVALLFHGVTSKLGPIVMLNKPSVVSIIKTPLSIFAGILVAGAATVALALFLDRVVYRPMRGKEGITLLISSIGVALALRYAIVFVWGTSTRGVAASINPFAIGFVEGKFVVAGRINAIQQAIREGTWPTDIFHLTLPVLDVGSYSSVLVAIDYHEIVLIFSAIGLMLAVHYLLQRTKLGKAMRAMADNKDLAQVTGIPTERVIRATWVIGAALAGIAGFLIVLDKGTLSYNLGWRLLLLIFSGVILGGIGSIYGAFAGGIIIAIASRLSLVWIPSDFARAAAFAVMILVLLYRPEGIFGGVTTA